MRSVSLAIVLAIASAPAARGSDDARTLFERGSLRRSAASCEQRLAADPRDAEAGAFLSRIESARGRMPRALELAVAAVAADPKNADAQYALAEVYGRKARDASVLHQPGLAGKMRKAADAALALDPNHVDALEILVDFHRLAPGIMGGDRKKAAEFVERLLRVDPVAGWFKRGDMAFADKDTTRGAECYRRALEAEPTNGRALVALASWLAPRWRDPARAEKLALQAIEAEPWRVGGWQVLASLYAFQERWPELESVLDRSQAADASHLAPWYQAGRQLVVNAKEPARAERYLRHYLSREPEIGAPSHAAARWRLGLALEQQGRKAEAASEIATAVKLDPRLEDAKKDLKRLKS